MAHPGGRPTKLTRELIAQIAELLPTVMYIETAMNLLEIGKSSYCRWIRRGQEELSRMKKANADEPRESEAIFVELWHAIKKAQAVGEKADLEAITNARAQQWQAAAWRLERRAPQRWGKDTELLRELIRDHRNAKRDKDASGRDGETKEATGERPVEPQQPEDLPGQAG